MRIGVVILLFGLLAALISSAFIVREDQQVIITQFREPVGDPIVEPGLHFKVPFIQNAQFFDKRFLEWQGDPEELTTKDKVFIFVDVYARWRIRDPLLYFQRVRDERGAQSRLDDVLDGATRNAIARHNLLEVIRTSNREPVRDESGLADARFGEIQVGREKIREEILVAAQETTQDLGIDVLDVQFRRINYSEKVEPSVFARMIAERKRIADRFRSEGQGEAASILGEMERELKRIESEAYRTSEEIRGRADAESTRTYAEAYDQTAQSRAFYEFLKSMETLESTIDGDTSLLLSTDGDFYRFLKSSEGR